MNTSPTSSPGPRRYRLEAIDSLRGLVIVIRRTLVTFGRVPFAFYVARLYLIHSISVVNGVAQGFRASQMFTLFLASQMASSDRH